MRQRILITAGAGFIGSLLANELLAYGYSVRVLDNLCPQVHGPGNRRPGYLNEDVELQVGDGRDHTAVRKALRGVSAVYHFVAALVVGQSMYGIEEYTSINNLGTAVLLKSLLKNPVQRLIVASSTSLYGEGLYVDSSGRVTEAAARTVKQVRQADRELRDEFGSPPTLNPTPESKQPFIGKASRRLQDPAAWREGQLACDRVAESRHELAARGLMV